MRSTTFDGERNAARIQAGKIAATCGIFYEEALRIHDSPPPASKAANIVEEFDEWVEAKEPGWKAKQAAEKAGRFAAWRSRRTSILKCYGSEEAAWAACWREQLILDAVAPWREANEHAGPFHRRWTVAMDGWKGSGFEWRKAPPHIIEAIRSAYPIPTTFTEAQAEWVYWDARGREMEDVLSEDGQMYGNGGLDRAADMRAYMIRDLVEQDLPVTTLRDLHARMAILVEADTDQPEIEKALFRDLTAMVEREASHPSTHPSPTMGAAPPPASQPNRPSADGQIASHLRADPFMSDRSIARMVRCSPTTVGNIRREFGLIQAARSVNRGGQIYRMRPGARVRQAQLE